MSDASEAWAGDLETNLDDLTAFDAMRQFLYNWWERSGKPDHSVFDEGDVLWLLSSCSRAPGVSPIDPAMWDDWKRAVAQVRRERELRSN